MDANVGLQRLFENVNTIPPTNVPSASEANDAGRVEQQNLVDIATNWGDVELDDHVMKVVQQTQSIVEDVQADANSIQEREKLMAEVTASASKD